MSDSDGGKTGRDWLVAAGVAVTFVAFSAITTAGYQIFTRLSEYRNAHEQNSRQIETEAHEAISQTCVFAAPETEKECVAKEQQSARNKQRDHDDLYAQQQMAIWAFGVGVAGFISVFLSLIGIAFVWRSLKLNREAIRIAERTISEQHRPYLSIEGIAILGGLFVRKDDIANIWQHFSIDFRITNHADTPAVIRQYHAQIVVAQRVSADIGLEAQDTHNIEQTVGSKKSHIARTLYRRKISAEVENLISLGQNHIEGQPSPRVHLLGYIRYENLFGVMDEFGFCHEYLVGIRQFIQSDNADWNYRKRNVEKNSRHRGRPTSQPPAS